MRTVGEWVRQVEGALAAAGLHFGHGTDNALDEAAWLVLHTIGAPLDGGFDDWEQTVDEIPAARIASVLQERIVTRQPLAYLLGEAWFCGLAFEVTPDTLVPRSPIAELIVNQFRPWCDSNRLNRVLDLCTGGGCIAIATALALPQAQVDGADLSEAALAVARRNASRHGVEDRTRWLPSDGFDALAGERYDLVVTNPPYVAETGKAALPGEFHAEPEIGLFSGPDGLDLPLRILLQCQHHLADGGVLVMEVGESAERLQEGLPGVPFTWLEFERGGEGVLTLDREALVACEPAVRAFMDRREDVG